VRHELNEPGEVAAHERLLAEDSTAPVAMNLMEDATVRTRRMRRPGPPRWDSQF
jgi:hypothetical protein